MESSPQRADGGPQPDRTRWPRLASMSVAERIASVGTWYHTIELGGELTPGHYDMRPYVPHYHLPDLPGLEVVDVGASNGFFTFLFEAMGARVTAVDLPTYRAHDYPAWALARKLRDLTPEQLADIDWNELHGGFEVCRQSLGSGARRVLTRIYDVADLLAPTFDLAFCSNVLVHLRDPLGALEAIRAVLRPGGRVVVATPILDRDYGDASPANFVGFADGPAWWVPAPRTLVRWLQTAGFREVAMVDRFDCVRVRGDCQGDLVGVVHGVR